MQDNEFQFYYYPNLEDHQSLNLNLEQIPTSMEFAYKKHFDAHISKIKACWYFLQLQQLSQHF